MLHWYPKQSLNSSADQILNLSSSADACFAKSFDTSEAEGIESGVTQSFTCVRTLKVIRVHTECRSHSAFRPERDEAQS